MKLKEQVNDVSLIFISIIFIYDFFKYLVERQKETVNEAADKHQKRKLGS